MSYFKCLSILFIIQASFTVLAKAQNEQPLLAATLMNSPYTEQPFRHESCPLNDDAAHPIQLPYPYDCNKYYSCLKGYAYLLSCPIGLQWSSLTYRCDYPGVAKCQAAVRPAPSIPPIAPINPPNNPNYPPALEYLTYAGDCSKYYQCQVLQCPPQLLWNARLQRCDLPAFATCTSYQPPITPPNPLPPYMPPTTEQTPILPPTAATPPPPPSYGPTNLPWPVNPLANNTDIPNYPYGPNETELDQLCSQTGAEYIHYPGDCHRFIQCNGFAFVQQCPANLYWNSELLTCDRYCK